jgi:hypothetical protein
MPLPHRPHVPARHADRPKTLDTGTDIPAHTLRLSQSGHRVHWRNHGEPKSARLR